MKSSIVEKIEKAINKKITNECQVLYILAQCRKYFEAIDLEKRGSIKYPALSLFSDWVLHCKLTGPGAIDKLNEYADFFAKQKDNSMFLFMDSEFKLFSDLKYDLKSFCEEVQIESNLFSDRRRWLKFVSILCEILKDLPLCNKDGNVKEFKFNNAVIKNSINTISFKIGFLFC